MSRERIRELSIHTQSIGAAANKESARKRKQLNNDIGNELVVTCHKFRDLCLLYWGEGCKTESHKYFSISNSDPYMVRFIIAVLIQYIDQKLIKIVITHHGQKTDEELLTFWKQYTTIVPRFHKIKNSMASKNKRLTIPFGTANIDVFRIDFLNKIMGGINRLKMAP